MVLWEHLVGAVLCGYAAARSKSLLRWLSHMLDNTERVRERLQVCHPCTPSRASSPSVVDLEMVWVDSR